MGYIKDIAEIATGCMEHRDDLIAQGIIGKEKNTDKLLEAIERSKQNDGYKLLTGFGIPNVGKAAAKAVMKHFQKMDRLMEATTEELTAVNDIGEVSAGTHQGLFQRKKSRDHCALKDCSVNMDAAEDETVDSVFSGKQSLSRAHRHVWAQGGAGAD